MKIRKTNTMMSLVVSVIFLLPALAVDAEDIAETVKHKAPTKQQTIGFIEQVSGGNATVNPSQCVLVTRKIIHTSTLEYHIPLKKINPSPEYVEAHVECVELIADGYEEVIKRINKEGEVKMENRTDVCTPDRESAEKMARALRYLISLCGGPPCNDCDPYQWQ